MALKGGTRFRKSRKIRADVALMKSHDKCGKGLWGALFLFCFQFVGCRVVLDTNSCVFWDKWFSRKCMEEFSFNGFVVLSIFNIERLFLESWIDVSAL